MKEKEIRSLLEKYYKGESTLAEENALREFFSSDDVPEDMAPEKEIFGYYKTDIFIPEPSAGFEYKILAGIEKLEKMPHAGRFRKYVLPALGAAASVLILLGGYFYFQYKNFGRDTYSDPQIAYAETVKILYEVSSKMNQATQGLEPVGKFSTATQKSFRKIDKSSAIIEKGLKNLNYLNYGDYITNQTDNQKQ
ncbi:MAG: hypothetical protein H6540_03630 [Bacteroidales bacterium]|nr:hypothetical protein [Bacteroidales bacterium]